MAESQEGFARSLQQIMKDAAPPNTKLPAGGFGLTLDPTGVIPNAGVLADFSGTAGVLNVDTAGAVTWAAAIGRGTTLPASPTDGQEYILVDSTTSPTYQWRFRYSTANTGTYKWEFVGGSEKVVAGDPNAVINTKTQVGASGYYYDSSTMSFTVPRAGDYLVRGYVQINANGGGNGYGQTAIFKGSSLMSYARYAAFNTGIAGIADSVNEWNITGCAASDVVGIALSSSASGTYKMIAGTIVVHPMRVS